ncbi:MAG: nicotinate-nucleotide diphosphorylase (carboxylating), partial [Acidobacteriota bacterium]
MKTIANGVSAKSVDAILKMALREDIGKGDITTRAVIEKDVIARGHIIANEEMIAAGLQVARRAFQILEEEVLFKPFHLDGDSVR